MKVRPFDASRILHVTIIFLLAFSLAQVVWWFVDQRGYAAEHASRMKERFSYEMLAAQKLAAAGTPAAEIVAIFPFVRIDGDEVTLAPEALADVEAARVRHV